MIKLITDIIEFFATNKIILGIVSFCVLLGFVFIIFIVFQIRKIKSFLNNKQSSCGNKNKNRSLEIIKKCKDIKVGVSLKLKQKQRRFIFEVIGIIGTFTIFLVSFMADISIFQIPKIFLLKIENYEELFFNLFAVQAATASIGIAIIALLSGANTENVYGICFSKFIANDKPQILKHNVLIIFNLSITFVNYFVVSYGLFNLSIAIFLISIIILIILVKETYVIFLGRRELKNQIKTYILENYRNWGLDDIFSSLNDVQNLKNLSTTKENFEVLERIYEKEFCIISQNENGSILSQLEKTTTDATIHILRKNDPELTVIALDHILSLYKLANNNTSSVPLRLWDMIIYEYFNSLKSLSEMQLDDAGIFYDFHAQLYKNVKFKTIDDRVIPYNGADLRYYSSWVYSSIIHSKTGNSFDMKNISQRLYDNIIILLKAYNGISKEHKKILLSELCIFAKNLIDIGDVENVTNLYFDMHLYGAMEEHEEFSLIVVLVYLYYLACREPLVDNDKRQEIAQRIIKTNIDKIKSFFLHINFSKATNNHLEFVRALMKMWEVMPEKEAKTMILDAVINDFFIFASLEHCWSEEDLMEVLCRVSPKSSFSLYSSYFSGGSDRRVKELLTNFRILLFGENNSKAVDEKVDLLRNVLYKKYKEDELTEGSEEEITKVTEDNFKKCINEAFEKLLKEQEYLLDSTETLPEGCITKDLCVLSMTLPNLIINSESLHDGIHNDIKSAIIVTLLRQLQNSIVFESVMYNDRKIQEKFIRLVKSNNIDGNTFIGNRDIFWTEDDKYLLKEFVDDMEKITYSFGYNQMFIMDRSAYYFNISNISVEFEDLNEEEIESQCIKDEDGKLMYNVTNDIYIPFEKEELTEHIHRIIKKVKINATVTYKITKNKVGAGIEIKVDD